MEKSWYKNLKLSPQQQKHLSALAAIFGIGLLGHLLPITRPLMVALTPLVLLCASISMFAYLNKEDKKVYYWALLVYLLTFFIEVVGVKTGLLFGKYGYGSTLGPKVFEVPVVIGMTWVFVILGSIELVKPIKYNFLIKSLFVGVLALVFDIFLEVVAIKLGYWEWFGGSVPLQNYIAWFVIAFSLGLSYFTLRLKEEPLPLVKYYFLIQVIFFLILSMAL